MGGGQKSQNFADIICEQPPTKRRAPHPRNYLVHICTISGKRPSVCSGRYLLHSGSCCQLLPPPITPAAYFFCRQSLLAPITPLPITPPANHSCCYLLPRAITPAANLSCLLLLQQPITPATNSSCRQLLLPTIAPAANCSRRQLLPPPIAPAANANKKNRSAVSNRWRHVSAKQAQAKGWADWAD